MKKFIALATFTITYSMMYAQDQLLIPYRIKNLWGYTDTARKIIIKPAYDSVTFFYQYNYLDKELAMVYRNKKVGLIDTKGKVVIPVTWDSLNYLSSEKDGNINALLVKKGNKYGVISYDKKVIVKPEYDSLGVHNIVEYFNGNFIDFKGYKFLARQGSKYFYFDQKGIRTEIPASEYSAHAGVSYSMMPYIEQKENKAYKIYAERDAIIERNKGIIDGISSKTYGNDAEYFEVYYQGKAGLVKQEELLKPRIEKIISPEFDTILDAEYSYDMSPECFLVKKDGFVSVIDLNGGLMMPLKYKEYIKWNYYYMVVKENNLLGFYRFKDKLEIRPKYEALLYYGFDFPVWRIRLNGKYGFIDKNENPFFKD